MFVSRPIRLLTQHGVAALKSSVVNGRYCGPLISKRIAADLRKQAIIEGTFGKFIPNIGGWDPAWDESRKIFLYRQFKGHKEERTREERAHKIDVAMKSMPEKLKKHETEAKERKPKKDIFYQFSRVAEIARGIRRKKI